MRMKKKSRQLGGISFCKDDIKVGTKEKHVGISICLLMSSINIDLQALIHFQA